MKGLELALRYWQEIALPAFERDCPEVLSRAAIGLVGEGSECFGFDDEYSRDHDWGPGFCIWLTGEDMVQFGNQAKLVYNRLPGEHLGYRRLHQNAMSAGRIGVLEITSFYQKFTGLQTPPQTWRDWCNIPEYGLSTATNGVIFQDPLGEFTSMREALLSFFPEDLRRKKLAAHCAKAAQSGQYNYARCMQRGQQVAALLALSQFIDHTQAIVFLLNRRFRPYYKWAHRAMQELPVLGCEAAELCDKLVDCNSQRESVIEEISALIIAELKRQGLSEGFEDFLLPHAERIQQSICDPALRSIHLMALL